VSAFNASYRPIHSIYTYMVNEFYDPVTTTIDDIITNKGVLPKSDTDDQLIIENAAFY
jgi:hypothetical protein